MIFSERVADATQEMMLPMIVDSILNSNVLMQGEQADYLEPGFRAITYKGAPLLGDPDLINPSDKVYPLNERFLNFVPRWPLYVSEAQFSEPSHNRLS